MSLLNAEKFSAVFSSVGPLHHFSWFLLSSLYFLWVYIVSAFCDLGFFLHCSLCLECASHQTCSPFPPKLIWNNSSSMKPLLIPNGISPVLRSHEIIDPLTAGVFSSLVFLKILVQCRTQVTRGLLAGWFWYRKRAGRSPQRRKMQLWFWGKGWGTWGILLG